MHVLALAVLRDPGLQLGILNFWQGLLLDVQQRLARESLGRNERNQMSAQFCVAFVCNSCDK